MNLFIIPSWYPSPTNPIAGIFFKEQAEAIADLSPDIRVIVSCWERYMCALSPRTPLQSIKTIKEYFTESRVLQQERENLCEISTPTLYWSNRLPGGGIRRHINANRKNCLAAIKQCGQIDLIHAHVSYPAGYIAAILNKEFNIPYVLTEHMSPFPFPQYLRNGRPISEINEAFGQAAKIIAVSPALAERIHSFGYPTPIVIPNLIDEKRFYPCYPTEEEFTFFTMGGFTEQKGIDILLKAIAAIKVSSKIQFWIAGDGPERDHLHNLAKQMNISKIIKWLGPVSRADAPALFRRCHAFILPSRHETFGVVYAEAIASGKPVIATRCGGPEFIVNQENGILVDVEDVSSLADAIKYMITNSKSFNTVRIREDFETRFSRKAVISQLHALYEQILLAHK